MGLLRRWSAVATRPDAAALAQTRAERAALRLPLQPLQTRVDTRRYMGRWHVLAK